MALLNIGGQRQCKTVTCLIDISEDDDLSTVTDLEGLALTGLLVPVTNGTPALTFQVCATEDGTFVDLLDKDGSTNAVEISGGAAAFGVSADDLSPLAPYRFVKVKSSVAQSADRTLTWILKR